MEKIKLCECGKEQEAGIRYLKGKLVCLKCWYKRQRSKKVMSADERKHIKKWLEGKE